MATIYGTNGSDLIYEDRYGGEDIIAGAGNDRIILWVNDDYAGVRMVDAGDGDDVIEQSFNGNGLFYLGAGNDVFYSEGDGWYTRNEVYAGAGNDTFVVDTQHSVYLGEGGDDIFYSTGWSNGFDGGAGNDWVSYELAAEAMTIDLGANVAQRGGMTEQLANVENARGTTFNDLVFGSAIDNILDGFNGNDGIDGMAGNDTIYGGQGNDQLYGNIGNDKLYGDAGNDSLSGGNNDDRLEGGIGNDSMNGDAGNDVLMGGDGIDTVRGGANDDWVYGDAGNDFVYGDAGNDRLFGGLGTDRLYGGAGNDTMSGDDVSGAQSADTLYGEGGDDSLTGGGGNDTMYGGTEKDTLFGGQGDDRLFGDAGNDTLYGNEGADRITGGAGKDDLWGQVGNDIFVFSAVTDSTNAARDIIQDFVIGQDKIDVSAIDASTLAAGNNAFIFRTSYTGAASSAASFFGGTAGEIVVARGAQTIAMFDTNGDKTADFSIALTGNLALSATDFIR
jgi:Ca2+-binding RTX toxin-like protein